MSKTQRYIIGCLFLIMCGYSHSHIIRVDWQHQNNRMGVLCTLAHNWLETVDYSPSRSRNCFGCDTKEHSMWICDFYLDGRIDMNDFAMLSYRWADLEAASPKSRLENIAAVLLDSWMGE